jgi:membrane protein required for colicin V production
MQNYDYIMIAVLIGATVFGFWKGMAWQIASLASLVVSYFASLKFAEQLAPVFGQQAPLNKFVAMAAIYVGTSLIIWTLFRFVSNFIDKLRLESFDKQIGAIIGFAKGVLLCVGITFFAIGLVPQSREAIVGSQSGHYIVALVDKAHSVFPPEIHQIVDPYLNRIEERLNPNFQPHGNDPQQMWPTQASVPAGWPQNVQQQSAAAPQQPAWPTTTAQTQPAWPATSQSQPAWPTQASQQSQQQSYNQDAYNAAQEPKPFPGPYSAEVPASRDY